MKPDSPRIRTISGGSSSIKFALYQVGEPLERRLYGKVDRIGLSGTNLTINDPTGNQQDNRSFAAADHRSAAAKFLIDWLEEQNGFASVRAVGHRVVHGMQHTAPELVTQELLDELHRLRLYDPDHPPREIELIEALRQRDPKLPQVACFDTAFHRTMPRVARLLPIPRRFDAKGVQRYGFHGLSYAYLMEEVARVAGAKAAQGRVILAHLGNGASLAAVPLVSWIVGALEGAIVVGGLSAIGVGLYSLGIPKESILWYEIALKTGRFVLIAHGSMDDTTRAKGILNRTKPERFEHHQSTYQLCESN